MTSTLRNSLGGNISLMILINIVGMLSVLVVSLFPQSGFIPGHSGCGCSILVGGGNRKLNIRITTLFSALFMSSSRSYRLFSESKHWQVTTENHDVAESGRRFFGILPFLFSIASSLTLLQTSIPPSNYRHRILWLLIAEQLATPALNILCWSYRT